MNKSKYQLVFKVGRKKWERVKAIVDKYSSNNKFECVMHLRMIFLHEKFCFGAKEKLWCIFIFVFLNYSINKKREKIHFN